MKYFFIALLILCLGGIGAVNYHQIKSQPAPVVAIEAAQSGDSIVAPASIPSLSSLFIAALQMYHTIDAIMEEMRRVNDVLDEDDITGIADSAHGDGSVATVIYYKDKNGDMKSCNSTKEGIARIAGEIKIMWANGKKPSIILVVEKVTKQISTLGIVVRGP